jgi:hypothetical protein
MTATELSQHPKGCPDPEDIAAFIDKTLEPVERQKLIRHFARCRDCYEIFAGAARYNLDTQPEEGNVVPFPRKKVAFQAGLAAAAVLAVAVGIPAYRSLDRPLKTARLVSPAVARTATTVWEGPTLRGPGNDIVQDNSQSPDKREFSLGVQVVNLQAGLIANNHERADDAVAHINGLLDKESFAQDIQSSYQQLRVEISGAGPSLQGIIPAADQAGATLQERLDSPYFELGRWAEAGFLAARARNSEFFESKEALHFPAWLRRHQKKQQPLPEEEREAIAPEVLAEVQAIQEAIRARAPAQPKDYDELKDRFRRLLRFYYPY